MSPESSCWFGNYLLLYVLPGTMAPLQESVEPLLVMHSLAVPQFPFNLTAASLGCCIFD